MTGLAIEPREPCLPARQRRSLQLLARLPRASLKKAPLPRTPPADPWSLDDLILDSMARSVAKLAAISDACGQTVDELWIAEGMKITVDRPESRIFFSERLREIDAVAQSVASTWAAAWHGVSENDVRGRLLLHDGWAISQDRLKTPAWMEPHTEMTLRKAATFPGCQWLLEIPMWLDWHEWKANQDRVDRDDSERARGGPGGGEVVGLHQHDVGRRGQGLHTEAQRRPGT